MPGQNISESRSTAPAGVKVAVIGAGGFIGRNLCATLSKDATEVVRISSRSGDSFDPVTGLLRDLVPDKTIAAVVYLSQSPHYRDFPAQAAHVWGVNVVSAVTAADWARRCGATRFIYASTGSVYQPGFQAHREDDPLRRDDGYALSKVQGEEAVSLFERDLRVIRARLFGVYGPSQRSMLVPKLVDSIRNHQPIRLHPHPTDTSDAGGLRLSLCYIDDAVDTLRLMLHSDVPSVANIAGSEVVGIRDVAEALGRRLGIQPHYEVALTPRSFDLIADNSRIRRLLGRDTLSFEAGVVSTVEELTSSARRVIP